MGKKLSSWEKSKREREREREAAERRKKTALRREEERLAKEKITTMQSKLGSLYVELFNNLINGLNNLTGEALNDSITASNGLNIPKPIIEMVYHGDLKFNPLNENEITVKDFFTDKKISESEKNLNKSFEDYKKQHGSFLKNLFGKTLKEYLEFLESEKKNHEYLSKNDKKRFEEFSNSLEKYKSEIIKFNSKSLDLFNKVNENRKNNFKELNNLVLDMNMKISSISEEFSQSLLSVNSQQFNDMFSLGLPIKFCGLDEIGQNLKSKIKELDKNFYDSPSNNVKYGMVDKADKLTLLVLLNEDYFPLPSEQQINLISSGYSIKGLLKKTKEGIIDNLLPGIALLYAGYGFNSCKNLNELNVCAGLETNDPVTGSKKVKWEYTLRIERDVFSKINFTNIIPFETIKLFKSDFKLNPENSLLWFKNNSKNNSLNQKIENIINLRREIDSQENKLRNQKLPNESELTTLKEQKNKLMKLAKIN